MNTRSIGVSLVMLAGAVAAMGCGPEAEGGRPPPAPTTPTPMPPPATPGGPAAAQPPPAAAQAKQPLVDLQKRAIAAEVAAFNAHDGKKMAEVYRAEATLSEPGPMGMREENARQAADKFASTVFAAFPDLKMSATRAFLKGDVAIYEWVATATHKGDKGPAKPVGMAGATISVFDTDGSIKAERSYYDIATINTQIAGKVKARAVPTLGSGEPEWVVAKATPEEDKTLDVVKAYYATYEKKADKDFLAMLTDAPVHASMTAPDDVKGKDGLRKEFHALTKAFPDVKMTPTSAWAIDGYVVAEVAMTGTHKAAFGSYGPTNKPVTLHGLDVVQVTDGKVAKSTSYASSYEFWGAIGALPQPKPAGDKAKAGGAKPPTEKGPPEKAQSDKASGDKAAADKGGAKPAAATSNADDPYAESKPLKLPPLKPAGDKKK